MSHFKNTITALLCLIISVAGTSCNNSASQAQPTKNNNTFTPTNKLFNSNDWENLKNTWKRINKLNTNPNAKIDWNATQSLMNELESNSQKYIDVLHKAGNINDEEKNFLARLFSERLSYLQYQMGLIMCYEMSMVGSQIAEKRDDLENRYDILEKLYKENKVSSQTFEFTRKKIIEDMEFINKHEPFNYNNKYIELITNLNS